jgi:hypothetical protein
MGWYTNDEIPVKVEFNEPEQKKPNYKYSEDQIIQDFADYIRSTYGEHYNTDSNIQAFDAWIALGDATSSFRDTAIKYLWRYGKKGGLNKNDLLKVMHYIVMMLYNDHYKKGE